MFSSKLASHQPQFICPHCQSALKVEAQTWWCNGCLNPKQTKHPFDVARQGYVNLLPVQNKKTKEPGDSQASIDARHRFLSADFYQPLQAMVAELAAIIISGTDDSEYHTWLDVGCGEGYYTEAIAKALVNRPGSGLNKLIALDISKPAVTQLAKSAKANQQLWSQVDALRIETLEAIQSEQTDTAEYFEKQTAAVYPIVASASQLPMADCSLDGISSIFSPILPKEYARVLKDDGSLIIAKPAEAHLHSMREALFDSVRPHDSDKFLDELSPYFKLVTKHDITAPLSLTKEALADLMTMTPYSYRAKAEKREALLASTEQDNFDTEARFVVYHLVKKG